MATVLAFFLNDDVDDDDVLIVADWVYFQLIMTIQWARKKGELVRISRSSHRQKPAQALEYAKQMND